MLPSACYELVVRNMQAVTVVLTVDGVRVPTYTCNDTCIA
jgi:hypothetical protein